MRRVRQCLDRAELAVFERIIELYAPYVLIRCAKYTNRRRRAQQIGAYTLISTCFLARELGAALPLGRIVDLVMGVVGPDVVTNGGGRVWWGRSDELLIVDQRMRKMAQALNSLLRPWREAVVLHHVTGMEPGDLARVLDKPVAEIVARISRGERLLGKRLEGPGAREGDVRSLLAQFAAGLDAGWIQEVADCAVDYLAAHATRGRQRHRESDGVRYFLRMGTDGD